MKLYKIDRMSILLYDIDFGGIMKSKENVKLKTLREEKKYTYQEMADKLHICKAFYWQIEHNNRRLTYELAKKIAAIFHLKPDDIFYDETN